MHVCKSLVEDLEGPCPIIAVFIDNLGKRPRCSELGVLAFFLGHRVAE